MPNRIHDIPLKVFMFELYNKLQVNFPDQSIG